MIRVLIVDDEDLTRAAFHSFIQGQDDLQVVGEGRNGAEAVQLYERLSPDLVLMDLSMPVMGGVDAARTICERWPGACIVVLTTFTTQEHIAAALRAGASGYLVKDSSGPQITAAIHAALAGDMPLSAQVRRELVHDLVVERRPRLPRELTEREREVLQHLARGLTNARIGRELFVSEGSVKQSLHSAGEKLGARTRTQILIRAIQLGIVDPDRALAE